MKRITTLTYLRAFLLLFLIVATAVAISGRMLQHRDNDEMYVTFWEIKDATGTVFKTGDLGCQTLKDRLEAASALSIIANVFYLFMLMITLFDLCRGPKSLTNYVFTGLSVVSFIFILVSWAMMVGFYHNDWCAGVVPKNNGYRIGYGLALLIAVWAVHFPMSIAQFFSKSKAAYHENNSTQRAISSEPAADGSPAPTTAAVTSQSTV